MQLKGGEKMPNINIIPENCRGCRRCEVACSYSSSGAINPRLAGIKIIKVEEKGKHYPVLNQQCFDNFCGKVHRKEQGEQIPLCVSTCLFDALNLENS